MKRKLILEEAESKVSSICQAACKLNLEDFITLQSYECRVMGALMELRIMYIVADKFGVDTNEDIFSFSKYNSFLEGIWSAAQEYELDIIKS